MDKATIENKVKFMIVAKLNFMDNFSLLFQRFDNLTDSITGLVRACAHVRPCVCGCACVHLRLYALVFVRLRACECICARVRTFALVCVTLYKRKCIHLRIHLWFCAYAFISELACLHAM